LYLVEAQASQWFLFVDYSYEQEILLKQFSVNVNASRGLLLSVFTFVVLAISSTQVGGQVTIYSSIDEPYLTPLMKQFERQSGIKVRVVTDAEATKTSGLVERIEAEATRPRADVYWGNEIFHTINLAGKGIFTPYKPATANDVPARYRDANDLFTGIGLRARVLVISTLPKFEASVSGIRGLQDLADPKLKGRVAISNPAFGTASGHVAAMYVLWGEEKFVAYMKALRENQVVLLGGNSTVVQYVGSGQLYAGLTDNDDVQNAINDNQPVAGVVPDQAAGADGTLLIPTTVALVKGGPNPQDAKKLIDFLCDPKVEQSLIEGRFLGYSVREKEAVKGMDVDYREVAKQMKRAVEVSLTILQDR